MRERWDPWPECLVGRPANYRPRHAILGRCAKPRKKVEAKLADVAEVDAN